MQKHGGAPHIEIWSLCNPLPREGRGWEQWLCSCSGLLAASPERYITGKDLKKEVRIASSFSSWQKDYREAAMFYAEGFVF